MDSAMAENMFRKAHSLWMGEGSAVVDNEGAFGLFQTAAQLGHAGAQCALGIMYLCGSGTERDDVTAVRWLKRAADQNYTRALRLLGSMWSAGRGLHADEDTRLFRECQEAADRGDPVAQHYTALLYECGRGTERSTERAVKYYEMAIERNYALSINNLGFMYYRGTGVPVDKPRGLELLQRAAALGLPIANTTLGFVHKQGDPGLVEKNLDKAIECFTLAADNGDAVAHLELGQIYAELNRHQEAFARFLQSAGFGHPSAFNALGLCCFSGKGTPVDLQQSLKWFLKAAEHDYPVSVYNVGYLYELDCKYELAAKWYRRAEALMCDTKGRHISVAMKLPWKRSLHYAYPPEFKTEVFTMFMLFRHAQPPTGLQLLQLPWELVFAIIEQLAELYKLDIPHKPDPPKAPSSCKDS